MAHNYKPNQRVRILTVQIAVDADESQSSIADGLVSVLSEYGMMLPDAVILDWQYQFSGPVLNPLRPFDAFPVVTVSENPEEGEAFDIAQTLDEAGTLPPEDIRTN